MTSAIKKVSFYTASPVQMCDRCGQGIKYVSVVTYADGFTAKYGMDCIERVLSGDTSLKALFLKNAKRLKKYQDYLHCLSLPVDQMPRGSEYFGSGLYFIADSKGKDICHERWAFHPAFNADKNAAVGKYVVSDPAAHVARCEKDIEAMKGKLIPEIARLESFLAKVLSRPAIAAEMLKRKIA